MRINEVYALLYESYRVMQSTWLEFMDWAEENEPKLHEMMTGSEDDVVHGFKHDLGIDVNTLAEAYEVLMKRNIKLYPIADNERPQHGDSSYWVSIMKQLMSDEPQQSSNFSKLMSLYNEMSGFLHQMEKTTDQLIKRTEDKKFKKDYKVIEKTPTWIMYQPEHRAAACHLGTGTKWCISARGEKNYFNMYSRNSDIYIIHTDTMKFAILIDSDGNFFEVQTDKNDFPRPNEEILKQFAARMKSAGVDVERVEELLNVEFTRDRKLTGIDTSEVPPIVADVADESSTYEKTVTVRPSYVFTNSKGTKETRSGGGDSLLIAYKKDGGVDISYLVNGSMRPFQSETVASMILRYSPAFHDARELPADQRDELIGILEKLLKDAYQLPPGQRITSVIKILYKLDK